MVEFTNRSAVCASSRGTAGPFVTEMSHRDPDRSTFIYESPIGALCCHFEGSALTGISLHASPCETAGSGRPRDAFRSELDAYFRGDLRVFTGKISFTGGTPFQRAVWSALQAIPYGEVRSYRWLAAHVGRPRASRAVGQALKRNPLPLVLPCHRVVASGGALGGFSWGVDKKRWLLAHEAASS